jgi:hypothetical protein
LHIEWAATYPAAGPLARTWAFAAISSVLRDVNRCKTAGVWP